MKGIAERMTINTDTKACLIEAATKEFTACLAWSSKIYATVAKYSASEKSFQKLYIASTASGGSAHGGLVLRKNLIFLEEFIRYVGVARAVGLIVKWYGDNLRKISVEAKANAGGEVGPMSTTFTGESSDDPVLTTNHLFVVFLLVGIGFLTSVVSFISEHIFYCRTVTRTCKKMSSYE